MYTWTIVSGFSRARVLWDTHVKSMDFEVYRDMFVNVQIEHDSSATI